MINFPSFPYPERARWSYLSQSQRESRFILPARGASRIISVVTTLQASNGKGHESKMCELNVTQQEKKNCNVSFSKRLFNAD